MTSTRRFNFASQIYDLDMRFTPTNEVSCEFLNCPKGVTS